MTSFYKDKDPSSLGFTENPAQVELEFDDLFEYGFNGEEQDETIIVPQNTSGSVSVPMHSHAGIFSEDVNARGRSPCDSSFLEGAAGYDDQTYLKHYRPGGAAPSPRIEITLSHEQYHQSRNSLGDQAPVGPGYSLPVPGHESSAYREPPCPSPASSNSSTSYPSDIPSPWASPCVSPANNQVLADLYSGFHSFHPCHPASGSPHTSPGGSPRTSLLDDSSRGPRSPSPRAGSRSSSPQGKRNYEMCHSPSHSRDSSPQLRGLEAHPTSIHAPSASLTQSANGFETVSLDYTPTKVSKTQVDYLSYPGILPEGSSYQQDMRSTSMTESYYVMPTSWPSPLVPGICSFSVTSQSPLERPAPSRHDPYELRVEVQPKPHHRAQYETEGSRGAVKAPEGGHPVVQLHGYQGHDPLKLHIFIGTADERVLKPHAFYQVHRITGKTVNTVSCEKMVHGTKVLEIPLEPKKNMEAIIDCVGILKLKNADIELRKGETDVGRKNTCVRLVFRVYIPESGGQLVTLQAASDPIECSQRSAYELPMVEKQDIESCSVLGGQQMILTGQNFTLDSKVVFMEKTREGHHIWKAEATVDKGKSQASMLFVEVPSYRDPSIVYPVKVNFYVINGKKKRSQPQHFTYTSLTAPYIKTEPLDGSLCGQSSYAASQAPDYYSNPFSLINVESCLGDTMPNCQQRHSNLPGPDLCPQQPNPPVIFPTGSRSSGLYHQLGIVVPKAQHPMIVHAMPPAHSTCVNASAVQLLHPGQMLPASQAEHKQVVYANNCPQAAVTASAALPEACPPVIQPQLYSQRLPKSRPLPEQKFPQPEEKKAAASGNITIKQENLDQAYLDDDDIIRKDMTVHGRGQT
ncbi:nuclear factor of activated T-cells, cytoplasmic 2-like isoform X2 [Brienomyrus brachyistius]|uniref:nuclear factor of activated T-cells, cytoplasmic 2-like isoform X2 n=1 Tax=Brienomyrus brachyistius TaxID=42636 RepID=UPI0020B19CB8|nr:nuclear factor of activated T-cells, cytoplasmic 2-like isoform X2 [Brienomyrus brachyistius]